MIHTTVVYRGGAHVLARLLLIASIAIWPLIAILYLLE